MLQRANADFKEVGLLRARSIALVPALAAPMGQALDLARRNQAQVVAGIRERKGAFVNPDKDLGIVIMRVGRQLRAWSQTIFIEHFKSSETSAQRVRRLAMIKGDPAFAALILVVMALVGSA
jgi:hypothetical protein